MKKFNYILLSGIVIVLCWIGYTFFEINSIENNLIGNIVPLISSLIILIIVLLYFLIYKEIQRINTTSLVLGSISLLFVLVMFFFPPTVLFVWNYAASIFILFIAHGLYLLTGAGQSVVIHRITLGLTSLFLITILLLKIELAAVHLIALGLCLITSVSTLFSVSPSKKN